MFFEKAVFVYRSCKLVKEALIEIGHKNFSAQEGSILHKKLIILSPNQLLNPFRFKVPKFVNLHCVGANRQLDT
jgi:hypothetical protein